MKYAVIALLFLAPATVAVAQDGGSHGPPASSPIIRPTTTPLPTQPSSTPTSKFLSAHVGTSLEEAGPAISQSRRRALQLA